MAGIRITAHEAACVGADEMRLLRMDAGAFAVGDARIHRESRRLAAAGKDDRLFRADGPWVTQCEVLRIELQRVFIRQAGAVVGGGEARNIVGSFDGRLQRCLGKVRSAGAAAANRPVFAHINSDGNALVLVLFDGFHIAPANGHRQALAFADLDGGVGRPHVPGITQHVLGKFAQLVLAMDKQGLVHMRF